MESIDMGSKIGADERAFRMDTNEIVAVKINRVDPPDDHSLAMVVNARLINDKGETITMDDGAKSTPVQLPGKVVTLHKALLAEGEIDVDAEMANQTVDACDRMKKHAAALAAWMRVPR